MYSVVLMMALTGSGDVPAFGHRHGCDGCYGGGCYGGACYGGGCYGGCHGYYGGCHGCYGGGCNGGGHRLFGHRRGGCHGCYGGGCYGGCYGYSSGCCGCCGGGVVYGGCYGGCWGGPVMHDGAVVPEKAKGGPEREKVAPPKGDTEKKKEEEARMPAPATILVSLPAEAKLTVDGAATQSTSSTREFASPALEPGRDYYYTLKADIVRDGKPASTSRRVAVRAGQQTRVRLEFPVNSVVKK